MVIAPVAKIVDNLLLFLAIAAVDVLVVLWLASRRSVQ
jgi:hypothetical protein